MFGINKKAPPSKPSAREQFEQRIDNALSDAMAAGLDARIQCDFLESRTTAIRCRWACTASFSEAW